MRASLLAVSLLLLCACTGDDLTEVNDALIMKVPATSVGRGDTITAVITNRSRLYFANYVSVCGDEGRPFDHRVGTNWVRLPTTDTLSCVALVHGETLHPGASRRYAWRAPSDTGTYRVAYRFAAVTLISHPFVVR
jgi:hypothetical protein